VLDAEATGANRTEELDATKKMIQRVEQRFEITPKHLIGDTAYGAAPMLAWLVEDKKIEPHIPVWDKSERQDGTFSRSDFSFDAKTIATHVLVDGTSRLRAVQPPKAPCSIDRRT